MDDLEFQDEFLQSASTGDVDYFNQLLEMAKDVNIADEDGFTALMIAAAEGKCSVVKLLLEKGADSTKQTVELKSIALHFAAKYGNVDVMQLLLEYNPDSIHQMNINADTPLLWACIEGRVEAVKLLLSKGAKVKVQNQYGATAVMCASMIGEHEQTSSDEDREKIIALLMEKEPQLVNVQDQDGSTALHLASACGHLACVSLLLKSGADLTLRNAIGQTALQEAQESGYPGSEDCIEMLKHVWIQLEEVSSQRMMLMLDLEEELCKTNTSAEKGKKKKKKSKKGKKQKASHREIPKVEIATKTITEPIDAIDLKNDSDSLDSSNMMEEPISEPTAESDKMPIRKLNETLDDQTSGCWTTVCRKPSAKPDKVLPKEEQLMKQEDNNAIISPTLSTIAPKVESPHNAPFEQMFSQLGVFDTISRKLDYTQTNIQQIGLPLNRARGRRSMQYTGDVSNRSNTPYKNGKSSAKWTDLAKSQESKEVLGMLACGTCHKLVVDNLECMNKECCQLYCNVCLMITKNCQKCHTAIQPGRSRHNAFAQCQADVIRSSKSKQLDSDFEKPFQGVHPSVAALALKPHQMLPGFDLKTLSSAQLEGLQCLHQQAISRIGEARFDQVRLQERMRLQELLRIKGDIHSSDLSHDAMDLFSSILL